MGQKIRPPPQRCQLLLPSPLTLEMWWLSLYQSQYWEVNVVLVFHSYMLYSCEHGTTVLKNIWIHYLNWHLIELCYLLTIYDTKLFPQQEIVIPWMYFAKEFMCWNILLLANTFQTLSLYSYPNNDNDKKQKQKWKIK